MRSAQRQVVGLLRRLGNQRPELGKANSLCKIVKCCVCCMMSEKAHTDRSNNEAMRCTMMRCDGRCSDAMHDGAMLWGDAMHDEAMR